MQPFTELRLRLRHAGYEPVPLIGKAPKFDNWQKIAQDSTDFTIINWETTFPAFENTGGLDLIDAGTRYRFIKSGCRRRY